MGYCSCIYVDANVQLAQRQTLQACHYASFMPFSFQTTPLLASVFCAIRREAYPSITGLDTPHSLALSIILCGAERFPVAGFLACTILRVSLPAFSAVT